MVILRSSCALRASALLDWESIAFAIEGGTSEIRVSKTEKKLLFKSDVNRSHDEQPVKGAADRRAVGALFTKHVR